jgi:enoyl-CoA hydratase/carnithine racemase
MEMAEAALQSDEAGDGPVLSATSGGICRITLSNPPANTLSIATMEALQASSTSPAMTRFRVIVLAAAPGKVFCAGHDLKEMTPIATIPTGAGRSSNVPSPCARASCSRWSNHAQAGDRRGGRHRHRRRLPARRLVRPGDRHGRSRFGVNGIDVGLFCSTPAVALSRKVHRKHAMEMLLTGEMIDAASAREFGLVNRVVPKST